MSEPLKTLDKSRQDFRGPRKPCLKTVRNYAIHGFRGVRLESVLLQNTRYTSAAAVARFVEATSAAPREVAK
ncbi:DUF1580 domain-containing protein [Novipirellula rosea]|uniref:DUF1580 domain-containing protein n=1 Tax=Novipirellula rosea TaxID=1031540 RepID=UPI003CD07C6F